MKIKCDFVTNSSSTSFCAWGICMDFDELIGNKVFLTFLKEKYEMDGVIKSNTTIEEFEEILHDDRYGVAEMIENILVDQKISTKYCESVVYIGIHPNDIPKDETIQKTIDSLKNTLTDLGINEKITWIEEAWYD